MKFQYNRIHLVAILALAELLPCRSSIHYMNQPGNDRCQDGAN